MRNRRRTRHVRNVVLSLSAVGLFLLCVTIFYHGLLEPLTAFQPAADGGEEASSAAGTAQESSALPVSSEEQSGAETSSAVSLPADVSSESPASSAAPVSSEAQVSSSQPLQSEPALQSEAPASQAPASSASPVSSMPPVSAPKGDPFPNLYVNKPEYIPHEPGDKVVYLTFDDGPSNLTIPVLDVLDRYGIKATFFVVGKTSEEDKEALRQTVNRGHTLAIHSYTHQYEEIYASPEAFLKDFSRMRDLIYDTTGVEPTIYRYAGGSVNSYNKKTARAITDEMNRRGYTYYDWNVDSGDAQHGSTAESIYQNVISQTTKYDKAIVLMHNSSVKKDTLDQLPRIIETLQSKGYRFAALDPTVQPINFRLPD